MFAEGEVELQIVNHLFGVRYSSAIYRAQKSARDGSGYAARGKPNFLCRWRGLAEQETTAPALQKPALPGPHLSGQPGGRRLALQQA